MIGLDTSFLVAVTLRDHPAHGEAWHLFESEIQGRDGSVALTPQVLDEYLHVATDPRRFERPLTMGDALSVADRWWNAGECRQVTTDSRAVSIFLDWMSAYRLDRRRILDTMLAASYRAADVTRIATTNWRDFEVFESFEFVRIGAHG